MKRWFALGAVLLGGCIQGGGGGGGARDAGAGDGGALSADGSLGGPGPAAGYTADTATVERVLRELVDLGCGRFYSDCADLCDQPFYVCGDTRQECVEEFVRAALDDYEHPVLDPSLQARCAQDVRDAACVDVPPDTVACENVLVEGCPGDSDELGTPWSFLRAASLPEIPSTLRLHLCDGVPEWVAFQVEAGQTVTIQGLGEGPGIGNLWAHLAADQGADTEPFELQSRGVYFDGAADAFGRIDTAGRHFVSFELGGQPTADLEVRIGLATGED